MGLLILYFSAFPIKISTPNPYRIHEKKLLRYNPVGELCSSTPITHKPGETTTWHNKNYSLNFKKWSFVEFKLLWMERTLGKEWSLCIYLSKESVIELSGRTIYTTAWQLRDQEGWALEEFIKKGEKLFLDWSDERQRRGTVLSPAWILPPSLWVLYRCSVGNTKTKARVRRSERSLGSKGL